MACPTLLLFVTHTQQAKGATTCAQVCCGVLTSGGVMSRGPVRQWSLACLHWRRPAAPPAALQECCPALHLHTCAPTMCCFPPAWGGGECACSGVISRDSEKKEYVLCVCVFVLCFCFLHVLFAVIPRSTSNNTTNSDHKNQDRHSQHPLALHTSFFPTTHMTGTLAVSAFRINLPMRCPPCTSVRMPRAVSRAASCAA